MNISKIQVEKSILNLAYSFGKRKEYEAIMSQCPLPKSSEMIALMLFDNNINETNIYPIYLEDYRNIRNYRVELNEKGFVDFKDESNLDRIKEYLSTKKGIDLAMEFLNPSQPDSTKFLKYLEGLTVEKFDRFMEWEKKIEQRYYEKGLLRTSNIFSTFLSVIPDYDGYTRTLDDGPFFGGVQMYGSVMIKTFCGQGCYQSVYFNEEFKFSTN